MKWRASTERKLFARNIRNVANRVQEEERSAIVQGRSVQRVFFYYTAPLSQPCSFSKLLTPPLFSPVIATRNHQKRINHCTNNYASRFYPTNPRKSSPRKIPKIRGILKSVEDSGSKSVDTNSFFSRKGVPLNRHAHSSRLASRGHPKTGQGRYGEEGVARGGEGNGTAAVPFPESPSGACAPLAWRSSVRFAGGVHR